MAMLTLKTNRNFLETEAYQRVREGARVILRVIKEGIESGEFKPGTDPYLVRSVIIGTIEHIVIRWLLLERGENLLDAVDPLTDLIIDGMRNQGRTRQLDFRITLDPSEEYRECNLPQEGEKKRG